MDIIINLKITQNISKIISYLDLANSIAITEFLLFKEFESYFTKLYQYIIISWITIIPKAKGPNLKAVQTAIIKDKSYNNAKYLAIIIDKIG